MFGKKECMNCGKKASSDAKFCPYCGSGFGKNQKKEDFGMLGENDFEENVDLFSNSIFGKISEKMISRMFDSTMKMLEKELKKQQNQSLPKTTFQLFINGKKVPVEGKHAVEPERKTKNVSRKLPSRNLSSFKTLPKKEPETNVRRFSNKVVYEINIPGLNSEKDISILKLENSIEIKAIAKNIAYQKIIPVSFPITSYGISRGKLVLELDASE